MVSSESLNFLQPNLVWWCIIMSQIVFQTDWYAVFKIKITVKDHIINLWLSELLIFLQLNLVWWHIITILWKDKKIVLLWSRSQERFKIPVNVHLDDICSTTEPSVTKFGMVMHHHEPVSCKKIGLLFSSSGSLWGLIQSNITVSTIYTGLKIPTN